ncbi:hypothetical protein ACG7TL_007361 [Trametes sanguinea]
MSAPPDNTDAVMNENEGGQARKRTRTEGGHADTVRSSSRSPERNALRKQPDRQNLWDKEARSYPPIPPPTVRAPSDNPTSYAYIPQLDPAVLTGLPTGRPANPHFQTSRSGPEPPQPIPPFRPFPEGPFQIPPINEHEFRGNMSKEILQELATAKESATPPIFLALIPHGAGKAVNANAVTIAKDSQDFLRSLAFNENNANPYPVIIHMPDSRDVGGANSLPFSKPWTFLLRLPHDAQPLYRFLMWQRVFAVSKTISFTVYELDNRVDYWDLQRVYGPTITADASHFDVIDQKATILAAIKRDLSADPDFRRLIGDLAVRNLYHQGDLNEALETVLSTLHLERTISDLEDESAVTVYVLMGRPPTRTLDEYKEWKTLVERHSVYRIAFQRFEAASGNRLKVWCDLCKSRVHCTSRCPWPDTKGWLGITPKDLGVRTTTDGLGKSVYRGLAGVVKAATVIKPFQGLGGPAAGARTSGAGVGQGRASPSTRGGKQMQRRGRRGGF